MYGTSLRISYGPRPTLAALVITVSRTKTHVIVSSESEKARTTSPITYRCKIPNRRSRRKIPSRTGASFEHPCPGRADPPLAPRPNRSAARSGDGVHDLRHRGGQPPDPFHQFGLAGDAEADPR